MGTSGGTSMSNTVRIYVEDITAQIADFDTIRLFRANSPTDDFTLLITTTPLVANQEEYSLTDGTGDASHFYAYRFINDTTSVQSALSARFGATASTLADLRIYSAREAGYGWEGTADATSEATKLVDAALRDSGVDEAYAGGAWIYRQNAVLSADRLRAVGTNGFTTADGGLTPLRAWTNEPDGETYQVFGLAPPIDHPGQPFSWDRAISNAFSSRWCRFTDQLNLGEGTSVGKKDFPLDPHLGYLNPDRDIRKVYLRTTNSDGIRTDEDQSKNGRFWNLVSNGLTDVDLRLSKTPGTDETVIVDVRRRPARLYVDGDALDCPFELAWRAAVWSMFRALNGQTDGKYKIAEAFRFDELRAAHRGYSKPGVILL